ncbi:uncharacterized protein with HEPN domain [Paraburkholderia unamae]|uniref:HepT-like ribonuclease domain-containing protein n=1 Tax=Paraburkholderia unamae TaxID=219649 RepID=UPI000DC5113F|nr:DUF86 domain-containing protein [Paraburkholderia unamae]RAR56958.1 uncharacterized protein with HEPN domain [Paraburkholderia unamae]
MRKKELRIPDYVEHMLVAIGRIREYTAPLTSETFESTQVVIDAVVLNLQILGEAAHNVMLANHAFAADHPEIPWQDAYDMRNRISHGYFAINAQTVWKTVQHDLPELEHALRRLNLA